MIMTFLDLAESKVIPLSIYGYYNSLIFWVYSFFILNSFIVYMALSVQVSVVRSI